MTSVVGARSLLVCAELAATAAESLVLGALESVRVVRLCVGAMTRGANNDHCKKLEAAE